MSWSNSDMQVECIECTDCTCSVAKTDRTVSSDPHIGLSNYIYCTLITPQTCSFHTGPICIHSYYSIWSSLCTYTNMHSLTHICRAGPSNNDHNMCMHYDISPQKLFITHEISQYFWNSIILIHWYCNR